MASSGERSEIRKMRVKGGGGMGKKNGEMRRERKKA